MHKGCITLIKLLLLELLALYSLRNFAIKAKLAVDEASPLKDHQFFLFLAHLSISYCHHPMSVVRRSSSTISLLTL